MSAVRWGLLGTARINRHVVPALAAAPRSIVAAVASRDGARAAAFAREWQVPQAVEGYEALLGRDDITAVYVPLPNSLHVEWTERALAAGKHVLCEKPLALDAAGVDRVQAAARANGLIAEEGFMYRHEPLTRRVVELVSGGAVGAVRAVVSGFTYARSRPLDVRLDPALGGGALFDVGCYPVSYAGLLMGRDAVTARAVEERGATGVDEECTGLLGYPGGATASIYAGFRAAHRTWLAVMGSEGSLVVPNPFKPGMAEWIHLEHLGERRTLEVRGSASPFVQQAIDFVASVLDGVPAAVSLAESRRTASALAALHAAAAESARPA